jgi:hypothetical protein
MSEHQTQHWAVSVDRNGENILTIESRCLSGRYLSPEDEATIRDCARQLLAFVGDAPLPRERARYDRLVAIDGEADRAEATGLHQQIMNLPCVLTGTPRTDEWKRGYRVGHKDARHAAAELVAAPSRVAPPSGTQHSADCLIDTGEGAASPCSCGAASPLAGATEPAQTMADAAEMLWIVVANVSGGDWTKQTAEWREAAARWRDNYFDVLRASAAPPPVRPQWHPIETAPRHDVLVYRPGLPPRDRIAVRKAHDWCGDACCPSAKPSHWMPLPVQPSASGPSDERSET